MTTLPNNHVHADETTEVLIVGGSPVGLSTTGKGFFNKRYGSKLMTQRSIHTGWTPIVIVHAGGNTQVEGWDSDRVQATTESRWGLKITRRDEAIDVQIGGSGKVYVPFGSTVKVYAGKTADIQNIHGCVSVYAGGKGYIRGVHTLGQTATGRALDIECEQIAGDDVAFSAGGDLHCFVRHLTDARLMITDLGGYWEGVIGDARTKIRLKAGGDVTLVTDRTIIAQPPQYLLGKIERPDETSRADLVQ